MTVHVPFALLKPMEPVLIEQPFDHDDYLYQVKWDGIRILSYLSSAGVVLWTKKGQLRTETYPELLKINKILKGVNAVLDGEAIVLSEQGRPSFNRILRRDLAKNVSKVQITADPVIYVVFDLLYYNDRFVIDLPLLERQELLADLLKPMENIFLCDSYPKGEKLFQSMKEKGMEGIVAKEKRGCYYCGTKNRTWLKSKCFRQMECVVGGIALKKGRVTALLLGLYNQEALMYIGRAYTGIKESELTQLQMIADTYKQHFSPFSNMPREEKGTQNIWLPPYLGVNVQYLEWSEKGYLRNPVILGFVAGEDSEKYHFK